MSELSRKQREIAERHALFLEIAKQLITQESIALLSMDKIAELAEYSKGTVYQHFSCKEEILIQLCNNSLTQLLALMERGANFDGCYRDRVLAIFYASTLWTKMDPISIDMMHHSALCSVKPNVEPASLEQHNQLEQSILETVAGLVQAAINDGELPQPEELNPMEIVYGLWSTCYGGQLIDNSEVSLIELGIPDTNRALIRTASLIMDGLQWKPLNTKQHLNQLVSKFETNLFETEVYTLNRSA